MLVVQRARSRAFRAAAAVAAVLMVLLVGFSRVYLGAHYLSDVLAGACVGIVCVTLMLAVTPHNRALHGTES
jgi:undecaprenyl-diphosphatase